MRAVLEHTAARAGFRCRELFLWRTGNLMANAAIVGFLPRQRIVLFSDALIAQLAPRELAAVFAHEIGHARRHHALVFGAWALGFFLLADVLLGWVDFADALLEMGAFLALLVLWLASFGYLSRRFELEADLESLEVTGDADALVGALEKVGGAHARRKTSWRHFSTEDRVRFLRAVVADSARGVRLRRQLRRWSAAGIALFVTALGLETWVLAQSFERDLVAVDLRLARYASAVERAEALELAEDEELLVLTRAVAALGDGADDDALLERLRGAFERGDADAAGALLRLARLRGVGGLGPLRDGLDRAAEGDRVGAAEVVASGAPVWADAFRAFLSRSAQ